MRAGVAPWAEQRTIGFAIGATWKDTDRPVTHCKVYRSPEPPRGTLAKTMPRNRRGGHVEISWNKASGCAKLSAPPWAPVAPRQALPARGPCRALPCRVAYGQQDLAAHARLCARVRTADKTVRRHCRHTADIR
jgi:hypothetical protein